MRLRDLELILLKGINGALISFFKWTRS